MPIDFAEFERRRQAGELSEQELAFIERELGGFQQKVEANPLQAFHPYPKQIGFLESRHRTKAFFGGNRAGKTEIGVVDDLIQCVDRDCLPEHLLPYKRWEPPFYCRVVFPKFGQGDLAVMDKLRALVPKDQLRGGDFDKALEKQPNLRLHFRNGSWIVFNTGDQDRNAHAGVKLHRVHFDEEPLGPNGWGVYQENRQRLVDFAPESQMMFTMTPQEGLTWTYDEIWTKRDQDRVFCTTASMFDNPHIPREEVQRRWEELPEEERKMLVLGEFAAFRGRVVQIEDRHKVDPITPAQLRGQQVYIGIDPGISRGGVVWTAFDRDNIMLVFDELYPSGMTIKAIADQIKVKNRLWGIQKPLYVIDPSARNKDLVNAENVEGAYHLEGIFPMPGQNDRLTGVLQLRARIEAGSLLVAKNCTDWLYEADRYLVAKDEDTQVQVVKNAKGAGGSFATIGPDHLIDPTRYVAMERIWYKRKDTPPPNRWTLSSGRTPPKSLVLGGRKRGSYGPLGSHG